jgi:hypothetical protein
MRAMLMNGKSQKLGMLLMALALIVVLAATAVYVPQRVEAGVNTTTSIDVYLDGGATPIGTITTSDILNAASYDNREYSGTRNNNSTGYYTTYGASLTELLDPLLGGGIDLTDIIRVDVTSPVGPNFTRSFCDPQTQLFTDRYAYSDLTSPTPTLTPVPATLSTTSAPVGSAAVDDDAIRLFFGTLSASEKNIPYFTSNINRIDLYTSGACPATHYDY